MHRRRVFRMYWELLLIKWSGGIEIKYGKKMIAPIVISAIMVLYYLMAGILFLMIPKIPIWMKLLMIIIPLALAGVMIGVLVSRIKEIRSGEENDLGKY